MKVKQQEIYSHSTLLGLEFGAVWTSIHIQPFQGRVFNFKGGTCPPFLNIWTRFLKTFLEIDSCFKQPKMRYSEQEYVKIEQEYSKLNKNKVLSFKEHLLYFCQKKGGIIFPWIWTPYPERVELE